MNILTDKQFDSYNRLSRYSAFPIYYNTLDNRYQGATTSYLSPTTPYILHTVKQGDTYDQLSLDYYNNPTYFWVICSYNHVQDCFDVPQVGSLLKIPVLSAIEFETYSS